MKNTGSKDEVWKGIAKHTAGGLTKKDLIPNKKGKIVSAKKSRLAKKNNYLGVHQKGGDVVTDYLADQGNDFLNNAKKAGISLLQNRSKKVIDDLANMANGSGIKKKRGGAMKQEGDGFLSGMLGSFGLGINEGEGNYESAGGKVPKKRGRKPKKQEGEGAWDDFSSAFMLPVHAAATLLPFL